MSGRNVSAVTVQYSYIHTLQYICWSLKKRMHLINARNVERIKTSINALNVFCLQFESRI